MHVCGIQKDDTDEPIYRAAMETDRENRLMDKGWVEEEGGMDRVT